MNNVVLLRVGIDTGSGGILGPVFADGNFDFVPVPDKTESDERVYGNTVGRHGRPFVEYFPKRRQDRMAAMSMHVDPEFETFTYGDPTKTKRGLSGLRPGDHLVFYAGLRGWDCDVAAELYLVGCFIVEHCDFAKMMSEQEIRERYSKNFHVRHKAVFEKQRDRLFLVKGGPGSRLFQKAVRLGGTEIRENGSKWQLISSEMADIFGRFGGIGSIQRSNPRWVEPEFVGKAMRFVSELR